MRSLLVHHGENICPSTSAHLPTRPGDPTPTSRNLDPLMHPFSRSRERMRALNAAKMERMFAKPFIAALGGHIGAVEVLCRKLGTLNTVASGSWDGGILAHNIAERKQVHRIQDAHKGKISDLCFSQGNRLLSCGVDTDIKLWDISLQNPEVNNRSHLICSLENHHSIPSITIVLIHYLSQPRTSYKYGTKPKLPLFQILPSQQPQRRSPQYDLI